MSNQTFILSEIELRYNPTVPAIKKPRIKCSGDAHAQFLQLLDQTQFNIKEEAAVLFLNRSKRVIGGYKLSSGGITGTVVDIRIILGMALKCLASGFIIAHTHPSWRAVAIKTRSGYNDPADGSGETDGYSTSRPPGYNEGFVPEYVRG